MHGRRVGHDMLRLWMCVRNCMPGDRQERSKTSTWSYLRSHRLSLLWFPVSGILEMRASQMEPRRQTLFVHNKSSKMLDDDGQPTLLFDTTKDRHRCWLLVKMPECSGDRIAIKRRIQVHQTALPVYTDFTKA